MRGTKYATRLGLLLLATTFVGACATARIPLRLVTPEEAALPTAPVVRGSEGDLDAGPIIDLLSPRANGVYRAPFPIRVVFRPRPDGHAVELESLKVFYRKIWDIDITDRLSDYLREDGIVAPAVEFPPGRHTVRIYLEDTNENATSKTFSVAVED